VTNVLEVGAAPELELTERIELLLRDLRSGPDGLSDREAARRLVVHGPNELRRRGGRRRPRELAAQFTHPLALLLWAAAGLAWTAGIVPIAIAIAIAIAIVVVIVINAAFAFAQDRQAERAVDALQPYLPPHATVVRDGERWVVDACDLGPGDVISIDEGDRYGRASALELARRLAHLAGADVRAITVLTPKVVLWPAAAWDTARSGEDASALQSDDRLLAGIAAELPDDVAPETMVGTPWTELTARSADPDLLVVGSRTRGPVRRLLFGSTSTTLGRHAACALLVAPAGARGTADGELRAGAPTVAS
jgi:nucleotide-binding universal stress UspA family protein